LTAFYLLSGRQAFLLRVWGVLLQVFLVLFDVASGRSTFSNEFIDTTLNVEEFLGTSKERVTFVADIDMEVFAGTTDVEFVAAGTRYGHVLVGWMDILFHKPAIVLVPILVIKTSSKGETFVLLLKHLALYIPR
jgi:hypothetical protein